MPQLPATRTSFSKRLQLIISNHSFFFLPFLLFILIGGLLLFNLEKGDLLLFCSDNRSAFGDWFFKYATKLGEELTYIGFILFFLFIRFRYALLIPLTGLIVTVTSFLSKNFFLHPRPSTYYKTLGTFQDIVLVEGVHVVKGLSSFPSGHTMSAFALFALVAFMLPNNKTRSLVLFFCALIVGLSRIYLVQHFFQDVYLGAIIGVILALIIYGIQSIFPIDPSSKIDSRIEW